MWNVIIREMIILEHIGQKINKRLAFELYKLSHNMNKNNITLGYENLNDLVAELPRNKVGRRMPVDYEYTNISYAGKILIIDDDIIILHILQKIFAKRGYDVILCSNPFEVMEIIKKNKINLIVIDIMLPGMDGFELTKLIRKTESDIPIIALSARGITEYKIEALEAGVDDYITKPFEENELVARTERAITRHLHYKAGSIIDGLTGVYTKSYFWKRAKEIKKTYSKNGKAFSFAFIDMDRFKDINDTYGHLIGDEVLKCFAYSFKAALRSTDQLFRFGGDEFIALFPETDEISAYNMIERFRKSDNYKDCFKSETNMDVAISFSAGISSIRGIDDNTEEILDRADKSLYKAKAQGGNSTFI